LLTALFKDIATVRVPPKSSTKRCHLSSFTMFVPPVFPPLPRILSFPFPPAHVPCPPPRSDHFYISSWYGSKTNESRCWLVRSVVYNTASRCGGLSVRGVSSECHFRTIFHTIALPKSGVLILAISRFSVRTDSLLIALERDLDVTRCNTVLYFFSLCDHGHNYPIYLPSGAILAGPDGNSGKSRDII
jgi:hypothetical protein